MVIRNWRVVSFLDIKLFAVNYGSKECGIVSNRQG